MCERIAKFSDGDAHQCLNILEILANFAVKKKKNGWWKRVVDKVLTDFMWQGAFYEWQVKILETQTLAALQIVLDAWETYERVGNSRERIYLGASCSLLRLVYLKQCKFIKPSMLRAMMQYGSLEVSLYLRNAPIKLMKSLVMEKGIDTCTMSPMGLLQKVN